MDRRVIRYVIAGALVISGVIALMPVATAQWVERRGKGWMQLALYHQDTTKRFDENGNAVDLFNEEARSITSSFYLTNVVGLFRGIDGWIEVPFHRLQFEDVVSDRQSVGFGDPRFHLRVGPELVGWKLPFPVAFRVGVKVPLGDLPVDAEIIPLTEGQVDLEGMVEFGYSFYPRPFYVSGWVGYRYRYENKTTEKKPGNEVFYYANFGGTLHGKLLFKIAVHGLAGGTPTFFQIPVPSAHREMINLLPSLGYQIGWGVLELGGRFPVRGQNLPAGPSVLLGYFIRWNP